MVRNLSAVVVVAIFIGGCEKSDTAGADVKDGSTVVATCDSIADATVEADPAVACLSCSITDKENVADDDAYTYASLEVNVSSPEGSTIRATAPEGSVFSAGNDAGVFYSPPAFTSNTQASLYSGVEVRTYLGGVIQESDIIGGNWSPVYTSDASAPQQFRWIHTTKDFDAVEFRAFDLGSIGTDHTWRVHEICSNGWVDTSPWE